MNELEIDNKDVVRTINELGERMPDAVVVNYPIKVDRRSISGSKAFTALTSAGYATHGYWDFIPTLECKVLMKKR